MDNLALVSLALIEPGLGKDNDREPVGLRPKESQHISRKIAQDDKVLVIIQVIMLTSLHSQNP